MDGGRAFLERERDRERVRKLYNWNGTPINVRQVEHIDKLGSLYFLILVFSRTVRPLYVRQTYLWMSGWVL